jgi:predicted dinucleotide-utilizing enzyme
MLKPDEPNVTRKIHLTYVTDEEGGMSIGIETENFGDDPEAVAFFLVATMRTIAADKK